MPGAILCACGKRLRVGANTAGKQVRCPFCARTLRVPAAPAEAPSSSKGPPSRPPSQVRKRESQEVAAQHEEQVSAPQQEEAREGAHAMTRGAFIALAMGVCLSLVLLFWALNWCGVPAPRWVILTTWGGLGVLFYLIPLKDRPAATKQDADTEQEEGREAPVESAPRPPPRPVVVLPDGVVPAPAEYRCAACHAAGVMVLPANTISRRPGYVCAECGTLMRPPGMTGAYVAVTLLGAFAVLLGVIMVIASIVQPTAFQDNQLHGSVLIGFMGALGGAWAVKQLRLATPIGATAKPVGYWPWIIALVALLVLLLVCGGGMVFLMYYIQVGF